MDNFFWKIITKFQVIRTKKLGKLGQFLISKNITANHLTFLSLITGILAIYFLFTNWGLLLLFTALHLLFDAMDGVVARLTKETLKGRYFDLTADSLPVILLFLKIGWFIQDVYAYVSAGLFTLSLIIFFISKFKAPFVPMRTAGLIMAILFTSPLFISPYTSLLTFSYIIGGVFSLYALARQLQWFTRT
jgi:phosphatidylglycerophosphate synthase